jgi:hypothetical protein
MSGENRLSKLLEQQRQLSERIKKAQAKQTADERRKRTRRLIILGAAVDSAKTKGGEDIYLAVIQGWVSGKDRKFLEETQDGHSI